MKMPTGTNPNGFWRTQEEKDRSKKEHAEYKASVAHIPLPIRAMIFMANFAIRCALILFMFWCIVKILHIY